jgi:hypothetical protein
MFGHIPFGVPLAPKLRYKNWMNPRVPEMDFSASGNVLVEEEKKPVIKPILLIIV